MIDYISDELLAAYIDKNTTQFENQQVENAMNHDFLLSEVVDVATDQVSFAGHPWDIHDGDYGYWELGLPPVIDEEILSVACDASTSLNLDEDFGMSDELYVGGELVLNDTEDVFHMSDDANEWDVDNLTDDFSL